MTIEELKAKVKECEAREREADIAKHLAKAELAEAEGRDVDAAYSRAYAAAQSHEPGGHDRFWALCRRLDAEKVIAGTATLDDFVKWERPGIAAEVERLRAASAA